MCSVIHVIQVKHHGYSVQVILKEGDIGQVIDATIDNAVISEKTYRGLYNLCEVVNVPGKTSGPKTLPWGMPDNTGVWLDLYLLATVY